MYEEAELAWKRIATRDTSHPLERIGRTVYRELSEEQWIEVIAAVCKNNIEHRGVVVDITNPMAGVVQDDGAIFPLCISLSVKSGGVISITPIEGGFQCKWRG